MRDSRRYAPGVGKSYRMLDEARRRRGRSEDLVVGAVQGRHSEDVQALLSKLELVSLLQTAEGQSMDVEAILARAPQVCVVDPLVAQNPTGSRFAHRWLEVQELLRGGISILTSVNLPMHAGCRHPVRSLLTTPQSEIQLVNPKRPPKAGYSDFASSYGGRMAATPGGRIIAWDKPRLSVPPAVGDEVRINPGSMCEDSAPGRRWSS